MTREELGDLVVLLAVAESRSFTRAAARLGTSQSTLSATVRRLEERLGLKLLTRTTRNVSTTEAGDRLLHAVGPAFAAVEAAMHSLGELREKPSGNFRITATDHAADTILLPALAKLLPDYPDIHVEVSTDYGLTDIVAERFDAGVRVGEQVGQGMIAVRIGPDMRMVVVGTPRYLAGRTMPQTPHDLMGHTCVNLRLPTHGGLYAWEFERGGQEVRVRVGGQLAFDGVSQVLGAALAGLGLGYVPEDMASGPIADGRLVGVLDDWCTPYPGYHLYYPSRRQLEPAFNLLVDALRFRP